MQGRLRAPVFCRVLGRFSPFLGDPTARRQTGAVIKVAPSVGDADGTNSRRGRLGRPGLLADLHDVGAAASRPEPWMTEVATDDKQPSPDGLDAGAATLIGA